MTLRQKLYTVQVFVKLTTRRFFRDKLAIFFVVLFPLIFLVVFGNFNKGDNDISFNVAVVNQSGSQFAGEFVKQLSDGKTFKVSKDTTTLDQAKEKLGRNQLDGAIILPSGFGDIKNGKPTGNAEVLYTQNNESAGQTLVTVLDGTFRGINSKLVSTEVPLTVKGTSLNEKSLSRFDYTFAGLLGFSIIGLGIFGPINVFPELKKQGVLRRLHTTPIRVWQYFLATMFSQAIIGIFALAIMFVASMLLFDLKVTGNYLEIALYCALGIMMILGIGLSIGGWASNERQAAPLANLIVFPMMFLSGTFFPRFLMPEWLQHVSAFLPLTPVIEGIRLLTTEGKHLIDLGPQLGMVAAWMLIVYAIAFRVFRWE
jgi:ABC-2 type transport system permease protein